MKLYPSDLYGDQSAVDEAAPMAQMNTTPLIDVMLVLIVMLIITIPMQLHAVPLALPSGSDEAPPAMVRVSIDAAGFVQWNGERITDVAVLDQRLRAAAQHSIQPEIHITPEPETPYRLVVAMTALAQKMGLRKVGVVN